MNLASLLETWGDSNVLAMAGALVGFIFGLAAQRTRFCARAAVVECCEGQTGDRFSVWWLAFGAALVGVQAQLDNCFQLLAQGRRTAVPRHQTLKATLDWSYEQLSPLEQTALQRLAVFKKAFTLDAAMGVLGCTVLLPARLMDELQNLVRKSLLSVEQGSGQVRYRLLNTTRSYALEKLEDSGELRSVERRYAHYVSQARLPSNGGLQLVE